MNYSFLKDPQLIRGKLLYLAGPYDEGKTPSGIMKGSISGYVAYKTPVFAKTKLAVRPDTYNDLNVYSKQKSIALQALKVKISQIGFASPVEGIQFFKFLDENREHLIVELVKSKPLLAKKLALLPDFKAKTIWPSLRLISTLLGAAQLPYVEKLKEYVGDVRVRDPGIYASEGRITLGITDYDAAGILVAQETFFEFCLETAPNTFSDPLLIDALELRKRYKVIITTKEGLYRYDMGDVIEVVDFKKKLPIVQFVSRSRFMNLVGELSSEEALVSIMAEYIKQNNISCSGYSFVPFTHNKDKKPSYDLLIEAVLTQQDVDALEQKLQKTIQDYGQMRNEFNRLDALRVSILKPGSYDSFEKTRRGQPKPLVVAPEAFKKKFTIIEEFQAK